jgi:hypothetical protein
MGHFLDYTTFVAADGSELYVYEVDGTDDWFATCVCSPTPLNKRQVSKAAKVAAQQSAENQIVDGLKGRRVPGRNLELPRVFGKADRARCEKGLLSRIYG